MDFLCSSSVLVEGNSRVFDIDGVSLLAVRRNGKVYLYRNRCPHRGIALNWEAHTVLDPSASLIQCAHHGALFLIESGECVAGPCEGEALQALNCEEDAMGIWLTA
ncbi:Rieske (2Fe-2S) protein [Pseudomonas cremoricolorata]|uniref:MFS transporter n=1 Tax=Pseudomonas cremoricolorata TaxID=157783 RepID=A0A089WM20_9PSED|nr:Rieske (2Fe-2S) protein [Pseudomonas cremoricolorata]AIR88174.1 MFS transporter [Pseudomonas cremoricolorata]